MAEDVAAGSMREQLIHTNEQDFLQWQWWNHHEGMWNSYILHTTVNGYNYYHMNTPVAWQPTSTT